jgi:hypothetical protein
MMPHSIDRDIARLTGGSELLGGNRNVNRHAFDFTGAKEDDRTILGMLKQRGGIQFPLDTENRTASVILKVDKDFSLTMIDTKT